MSKPLAHSYSAIKDFEGCQRRYHQVRIVRAFKSQDTTATLYGTAVHKAFEEFIRDGHPLPESFKSYLRFVEPLAKLPGQIKCEEKMGIRRDFSPCGFFDKDVWFRGVPDFLAIREERGVARVADFKTGKSSRYADPDQLELMAAMVMAHYPSVTRVKGALLFVVADDIVKAEYTREQLPVIWSKWAGKASTIEAALQHGVWNATPSALCRYCPLSEAACEHKQRA